MTYKIILPPPQLQHLALCYLFFEKNAFNDISRVMPRGFIPLIFHNSNVIKSEQEGSIALPSVMLDGEMNKCKNIVIKNSLEGCGIAFYPFALPLFFNCRAKEILNEVLDARLIFKDGFDKLQNDLFTSCTIDEKVKILNNFLLEKLHAALPDESVCYVGKKIMESRGIEDIDTILKDLNISRRQMERRFSEHIGLPMKYYSRLTRFQFTLLEEPKSLTELAYTYNYADQAHFTREFKEFSGMRPKEYFKGLRTTENYLVA